MRRVTGAPTKQRHDRTTDRSLEEVITRFTGEWALPHITRIDDRQLPSHGRVAIDDGSHQKVCAKRDDLAARPGSGVPYYIFHAQPAITTGAEARLALEHLGEFVPEPIEPRR